ncbi:FliI/YscN family ATPase [Haematobacter genomosp. 1]|uniref:Flagellum-specific ATP synthase FliI n=1 Tax=Haematobacter genomosp. 1 TaxID=366618 RepID=A0A212AGW4_9RHOB|nr:FliI/YscN family ATPase [Haematobacter genomosp. 1]OWJ80685.1 flagellum-specific ATP synthase FliI [Haematobacter genomosp. 1]
MSPPEILLSRIAAIPVTRPVGRVVSVSGALIGVGGLPRRAALGDRVEFTRAGLAGEIVSLTQEGAGVLPEKRPEGLAVGDLALWEQGSGIAPDESWIGRLVDASGKPLDGRPLGSGVRARDYAAAPPDAALRRPLGTRMETGLSVFNTLLPLVRGQRIGLFAGSGVGKSTLLAALARHVAADVVVVGLVGERGREVREFVDHVLGPDGMARAVVVAATSDQSPLLRRRAAWTAMAVAEHFRDAGKQVLLLMDSVTRYAEAHREIALASGEPPSLRGFPPSTSQMITALAERAGPGPKGAGDITAIFSVLVAGSDMEEPVADILRGVLDGHVVMDRSIAERGRFPAIDLLRSVSRSLPAAASAEENLLIGEARRLLGAYDRAEMMIQAGLYVPGSDPLVDRAIAVWPALDAFLAERAEDGTAASFARLAAILA